MIRSAVRLAAVLALLAGAARADITVFAAASLKGGLDEAAATWSEQNGSAVRLSFAGSSALARQILQGAPADIFISASSDWMDTVEAEGALIAGSRRDLLGNELVLIGPAGAAAMPLTPETDLLGSLGDGKLAMALVSSVPAGVYGKAALQWLGLWRDVQDEVAQTDNVRAALALVAWGEAPLGVVYASDAAAEPRVAVIATFPAASHPPIVYPAALVSGENEQAAAFLDFLSSTDGRAFFLSRGFRAPE